MCKLYVRGFTGSSGDADENTRTSRPEAAAAIPTLMCAHKVLAPCDGHLTPVQPLLLLCCLLSKHYGFAARTLLDATVITEMEPKETAVSQTDFLLYCYYGYVGTCFTNALLLLLISSHLSLKGTWPIACACASMLTREPLSFYIHRVLRVVGASCAFDVVYHDHIELNCAQRNDLYRTAPLQ